ncbi:MAG: N-6 DNA methylase [Deltaproteobacteria bacterium]|nr:N-6 DNA methylase [Deltaproteobacteria bacterium]
MQELLDSKKNVEERRRLGQFSTPSMLAEDIIAFGLNHGDISDGISFFDPAFGTGAFYSAILRKTSPTNIIAAEGIEIDPMIAHAANMLWDGHNVKIVNADFTKRAPDHKFNLIVCNPPYVRHHLIESAEKTRIQDRTEIVSGVRLSGLSGLYCHFLLQSVEWMEKGGLAGWLVPSEFMDVNYGKEVKSFLLSRVELLRIHRFDPKDVQFGDALVSSAILWFKNKIPENNAVAISFGGTLENPKNCKDIEIECLCNEQKWTRFPNKQRRNAFQDVPKLDDFFEVKRGLVTGGNDYFIMEKSKISELGLPARFFRPILPSPRYLRETEILSDTDGYPILAKQLFLLDCRLSEREIRSDFPKLFDYLESGKNTIANGYICKNRKCWYIQEYRDSAELVFTYMGRKTDSKNNNAFRFILNHSKAVVTNSYYALYPRRTLSIYFSRFPYLKRKVWLMLNALTSDSLDDEGRVYGGGLQKIEPKELMNIDVPFLADIEKLLT